MREGPRSCLLCGATTGLTREHVFPQWLRRAIPLGDATRVQMTLTHGHTGEERVLRDVLKVTLREVCAECNHGWLHDLERAFRALMLPAIEGRLWTRITLSEASQKVVAIWAVKTWFLVERALLHFRGAMVEGNILTGMRRTNEPPDMTQVWIGQMEVGHSISLGTGAVWTEAGEPRGTLGVMVLGGLVVVIFAVILQVEGTWQTIGIEPGSAFQQVLPHEAEEVLWPPPTIITEEILRDLFDPGERLTV